MIDIHSHIISEIDDGARSMNESLALAKKMSSIGITDVIATPHYITASRYVANNNEKQDKLEELIDAINEKNISLNLYLGNEIFIDFGMVDLLKKKEITTLNESKYILVELPVTRPMNDMLEFLFILRSKGYVPIIAHPERYLYLQENHEYIDKFLKMGCLFQGNLANAIEKYGAHAKKLFIHMLKNNQYQILATDVHHESDILFKKIKKIEKEIIKLTSKEKYYELTVDNPQKILENRNIELNVGED